MEAKEEKRESYLKTIKEIPIEKLVYIDESGIERNSVRDRGWGKKGVLLHGKKSGKYYLRTNVIAGLLGDKAIVPVVFNGSCNTELFETWVEQFLIKELEAGQVVIMDNASFHKSQRSRELIESIGCSVVFLPPYSPDLNPIEKFWANMKCWIKSKINQFNSLYEALVSFFTIPNSG